MIKPINIADVLRYVNQATGFLDHFDHVLPVQPKSHSSTDDLLAVIIGNGTNHGVYGMANISDRSYRQLQRIQANYVRPETMNKANDAINNAVAKLSIFKHYTGPTADYVFFRRKIRSTPSWCRPHFGQVDCRVVKACAHCVVPSM